MDYEKLEEREATASALNDYFKSLSDEDILEIYKEFAKRFIRDHFEEFMR